MNIPPAFIDDLLSRIDLMDIIGPRVALRKTGKVSYKGLCPFHQEKTPSFSVNQAKQLYHCFGCKASGNAISFLRAYDKLSYLEAVDFLARKAGLPLPKQAFVNLEEKRPSTQFLEECAHFFKEQLSKSPSAQQYLNKRGLNSDIIKQFNIGYAPAGWDHLKRKFSHSRETEQALLESGMLVQKEDQGSYDFFRDRIMFPIRNKRGQVIAFGGRSLKSAVPKYLNSPESIFFHKSRELYGLHEALQSNKRLDNIIIVEGYLDVIALHQYGLTQTVATSGTAISIQQIQTLLRFSEQLLFCFDGDSAGRTAAWRALEIALPLVHTGIDIRFLFLPNQEDPDSYMRNIGINAFKKQLQTAVPLTEFFLQKLAAETEIDSLSGKTRFAHLTYKYLQKLPKGIFRELMMERVAKVVGLNMERLNEILHNEPISNTQNKPVKTTTKISSPVRLAISLLIQCPKLLETIEIPVKLYEIKLEGISFLTRIMSIIRENPQQTTGSLLEYFKEDNEKSLLCELAVQDLLIPEDAWQNELQGSLTRIIDSETEKQIHMLLTKGKQEGLTSEEKKLLQNLLISQKQL